MKSKRETFDSLLQSYTYKYDLRPLFDDFLTMTVCAFGHNPISKKSNDEDTYLEVVGKYPKEMAKNQFPRLLGLLVAEMEERNDDSRGNDVLGEFYEQNFCRKNAGQFFTPQHICDLNAQTTVGLGRESEERLRILDPCCGSGRMLLSVARIAGKSHRLFGIDIDLTCVKMAALNLFLNGIFHGEVLCADTLSPADFRVSYKLSFLPFGIFRIAEKERSWLWHAKRESFRLKKNNDATSLILPSQENASTQSTSQLQLF